VDFQGEKKLKLKVLNLQLQGKKVRIVRCKFAVAMGVKYQYCKIKRQIKHHKIQCLAPL